MNIRICGIMASAIFFLATSTVAFTQTAGVPAWDTLFAVLAGGNEVSPNGQAAAGDPDGHGSATVILHPTTRTLCYAVLVHGIDAPVAAHIHNAPAGRNGPIVVPLTPPAQANPGNASGCIANLDPALLAAIEQNPGAFYVNVHTAAFPEGAVRGQLF